MEHPWFAARLEASALRGKKRISSQWLSFPSFTTVALEVWTLWDNAPKAPLSPLRDKWSSSWQQRVCGWPRQQRGPLLVTGSSAHGCAGEQFLPDRIQPRGLEEKDAGTCSCVCKCLYQTHLCMHMHTLHMYACILHMHIMHMYTPSCFKQAGVWMMRDGVRHPESQRRNLRRVVGRICCLWPSKSPSPVWFGSQQEQNWNGGAGAVNRPKNGITPQQSNPGRDAQRPGLSLTLTSNPGWAGREALLKYTAGTEFASWVREK